MYGNVGTRFMSSDRQAGNQGNLGFVPTNKEIVEMELDLIDFSEISKNDYPINICDLSGGTGDQLYWTKEYLKKQGINATAYYNELSENRFNECCNKYTDEDIEHKLNADFFKVKAVHKESGRSINKKVFSIIRNNPPYMYIQKGGRNVRAEVEFFIKSAISNIAGGIQIFEVPLHQLTSNRLLEMLCYRYEIFIAKFPLNVYEKYKQVAIICKNKKEPSHDGQVAKILNLISNNEIPFIDEIEEKVCKLEAQDFRKTKTIDIFRDVQVSEMTLKNGLDTVLDSLIANDKKVNKVVMGKEKLKPIIELQPGHVSQLLSSGKYDGIMGDLLIKGGANKEVQKEIIKEDGKETEVETEVLKPYIEITNKAGDILYKDF